MTTNSKLFRAPTTRDSAIVCRARALASVAGGMAIIAAGLAGWRSFHASNSVGVGSGLIYVTHGYGGYQSSERRASPGVAANSIRSRSLGALRTHVSSGPDAVAPAFSAYSRGDFKATETAAREVIANVGASPSIESQRAVVRARDLEAFAMARSHDLAGAREQFALLRQEARALPDHGQPAATVPFGEAPPPTFEENAAYQHAVCTGALGDKAGAEGEYVAFMRQYPDSPLLQAAVKRIAALHGGDVPKADEAVWRMAMTTAHAHELATAREASMCGPRCLAELQRRSTGSVGKVAALAMEMKTSERGTSLADLQAAARRHGFPAAQGVALTAKGLAAQHLPIIALVVPGHYVVVDRVTPSGVRVWDPAARNGESAARDVPARDWAFLWKSGIALALR